MRCRPAASRGRRIRVTAPARWCRRARRSTFHSTRRSPRRGARTTSVRLRGGSVIRTRPTPRTRALQPRQRRRRTAHRVARGVVPVGLEARSARRGESGTVVPGDGDAAGVVPVGDGPAGSVSGAGSVTGAGTSGSVPGGRTGGSAGCVPSGSATGSVESVKSMTLPVAFVACSRTWIVKPASSAVAVLVVARLRQCLARADAVAALPGVDDGRPGLPGARGEREDVAHADARERSELSLGELTREAGRRVVGRRVDGAGQQGHLVDGRPRRAATGADHHGPRAVGGRQRPDVDGPRDGAAVEDEADGVAGRPAGRHVRPGVRRERELGVRGLARGREDDPALGRASRR